MNRRQAIVGCCSLAASLTTRIGFAQWPTAGGSASSDAAQWPGGSRDHANGNIIGQAKGCYLASANGLQQAGQPQLVQSSGIPYLDQVIPAEAILLNQFFGVSAGFAFVVEGGQPNAVAVPQPVFPGTRATVLFGLKLMQAEIAASPVSGNSLIAIMAHEWGHVLQYAHGIMVPGKRMELSSDFMAGWWIGMKALNQMPLVDVATVAKSLFDKGDYAFNSTSHHGTPNERVAHMQQGYLLAIQQHVTSSFAAFTASRSLTGL